MRVPVGGFRLTAGPTFHRASGVTLAPPPGRDVAMLVFEAPLFGISSPASANSVELAHVNSEGTPEVGFSSPQRRSLQESAAAGT
jgi:hypothetical protein